MLKSKIAKIKRILKSHPRLYVLASKCYHYFRNRKNDTGVQISTQRGLSKDLTSIDSYQALYQNQEDFSNEITDIKTIAYHLPQFHTFPENDEWWGKGFTEWTNTRKAKPLFNGHYQPREPHETIGYYDLSDIQALKKQAELAKAHGIHGFCFYKYWFHGKELMEKPMKILLANPEVDIPFCFCWANETWSKRWDGLDHHILIKQTYSKQDDINFIKNMAPFFRDRRYIRNNGKPMLLVYRIHNLPDIKATTERWRTWCKENDIGEIFIISVMHGEVTQEDIRSPEKFGVDAYVSFPPHNFDAPQIYSKDKDLKKTNIFDYQAGMENFEPELGYKRYECAMLGWDNTPRRKDHAHMFVNYSTKAYYQWLRKNIEYTRKNFGENERFIFINAWNEWAEGTYLEPDKKYGYAYLNTTSRALFNIPFEN